MPGLRSEESTLSARIFWLIRYVAAGAAFTATAAEFSFWCADARLAWTTTFVCSAIAAVGATVVAAAPELSESLALSAAGGVGLVATPALLRFLSLASADPRFLRDPLDAAAGAPFILIQIAALGMLSVAALARAARAGPQGGRVGFIFGAAFAGIATVRGFFEPALIVTAAGLMIFATALWQDRTWTARTARPFRFRVLCVSALAATLCAGYARKVLPDVWMARLHASYPGGEFLSLKSDGAHVWGAYRFSNGFAVQLRDGVPQAPDPLTVRAAMRIVLAQRAEASSVALVDLPEAGPVDAANADGAAAVSVFDSDAAQAISLDSMSPPDWRRSLASDRTVDVALIFVARPAFGGLRRPDFGQTVARLRPKLSASPIVGFLLPEGASASAVDDAVAAGSAFGRTVVADLPRGVLVVAGPGDAVVDLTVIGRRFSKTETDFFQDVRWRESPSTK